MASGTRQARAIAWRAWCALEAARALAAEHYAFADEAGGLPADSVAAIAARLVDATVWTFWWH